MGQTSAQACDNFPRHILRQKPAAPRPGLSLRERIGNTPLLRFDQLTAHLPGVTLLGKAEWHNPGGSVKDRAAANIVAEGRRSGQFGPGKILLDATSGNTGIAYAMLGAAEGFPVTLCMPQNVSAERKKILSVYGANILLYRSRRRLRRRHPHGSRTCRQASGFIFLRRSILQRCQLARPLSRHRQRNLATNRRTITHFVAMLGTSGTFMGTTRRLKELNPAIRCISLQPDSSFHGIEGAKHMASAIVPKIYDPTLADENLEIATEDAYAMARRMARECGLLLGISAAASIAGSLKVCERFEPGKEQAVIVTILSDSGDKYLSERFWTE